MVRQKPKTGTTKTKEILYIKHGNYFIVYSQQSDITEETRKEIIAIKPHHLEKH